MKKNNVVSKRRPRQNIISMILTSAKQKHSGSTTATPNTTPSTKSSSTRSSRSNTTARKSNKLIASAVELTRRSKSTSRRSSVRRSVLLKGSRAFYRGPKGIEKVTVVGVHHDAKLEPYYTIKFRDGKEKQMDGKCLTPIEERKEDPLSSGRRESTVDKIDKLKSYEQTTDQCSSSSSEPSIQEEEEDRFHPGQDAYYRSPSGEGVTKIKVVNKASSSKYSVAFGDGTERIVEACTLAGLIDLTSKELASLMKEKNERNTSSGASVASALRSSIQSKESTLDQGYEPEAEPSSSENSYEDNIESPGSQGDKKILALPCAVQMVEAKTEEGGTKLVPMYKAEMDVYYRGPQGVTTAHIVKTHLDDLLEPYYTIRLEDGREKQTDNAHISLEKPEEEPEEEQGEDEKQEEDVEADDWYQEWKESQMKQDQALRDEIKQYEEQNSPSVEEGSTATPEPEQSNVVEKPKTPARDATREHHSDLGKHSEHSSHSKEEHQLIPRRSKEEPTVAETPQRHEIKRRESVATMATLETTAGRTIETTAGRTVETTATRTKRQQDPETTALVQAPQFQVGDAVLYNSSKGDHTRATITKVRKDDKHRPYFVIKLSSGDEKKVYGHRLTPVRREQRDPSQREPSRTRSRSRVRRERDRSNADLTSSKRAASMDVRGLSRKRSTSMDGARFSRMASMESNSSRDQSVDRSRASRDRLKEDRRTKLDRSRSMSRPPKEHQVTRGRRAESRDPRGRVHPTDGKERSRSKSVRASTRDSSKDISGSDHRQRARSRSRAPDDSLKRSHVSRKAPMVMGVSHRVQHIGDDDGSTARSKAGSTSRFGKLKSSLGAGITKAKQRSFDRS